MKIYLLEDNAVFTKQFCRLLNRKGIEYVSCNDIRLYKFEEADAYLIDLQIGSEMSYDVIKDIRSHTKKPIALITHHDKREYIQEALESGISYMIPKDQYELYGIHLDLISKM